MENAPWSLQNAKAQFSAVVDAGEYERLLRGERAQAPGFIEHLLAMPREGRGTAQAKVDRRPDLRLRDLKFR